MAVCAVFVACAQPTRPTPPDAAAPAPDATVADASHSPPAVGDAAASDAGPADAGARRGDAGRGGEFLDLTPLGFNKGLCSSSGREASIRIGAKLLDGVGGRAYGPTVHSGAPVYDVLEERDGFLRVRNDEVEGWVAMTDVKWVGPCGVGGESPAPSTAW